MSMERVGVGISLMAVINMMNVLFLENQLTDTTDSDPANTRGF